jgi:DNA-binding transcriptional LysR family regulator
MGAVPDVVVPVLNVLRARQPNLAIEVVEDTSQRMLHLLDDGCLDLVIGRASASQGGSKYHYQPLRDEPLSVVVGYQQPPFDEDEITLRQLKDHRWLVYSSRMPLHTLVEREMDLAGMSLPSNQISTASTFVTIAVLQRSTDIVALLPTDVADFFERHRIVRILPIELRSKHQTFGMVTRKGGALSPAANQFIQLLRDWNRVH